MTRWLSQGELPVRCIQSDFRYPQLVRNVLKFKDRAEKDDWINDLAVEVSQSADRSMLVFVNTQADTRGLAKKIGHHLGSQAMAFAYHAGLPIREKNRLIHEFRACRFRILVCTSALEMGVNTPASDVVVRDPVIYWGGQRGSSNLLQMMGRAGRADRSGHAYVLFSEAEDHGQLVRSLETDSRDPLLPQLIPKVSSRKRQNDASAPSAIVTALLGEIASKSNIRIVDLETYVSHTYSAICHGISSNEIQRAVQKLESEKLIYRVENTDDAVAATRLGRTVSYSGLQAETGAMFGAFLRALISLSEKSDQHGGSLLHRLADLDFLVLASAAFESRTKMLSGKTSRERDEVNAYIELLSPEDKPLLNLWRDPDSKDYPTRRILSTLRFESAEDTTQYWGMLRTACMLRDYALSRMTLEQICSRWNFNDDLEGRILPMVSWLLNALANICHGDRCYRLDFLRARIFHLIQNLAVGGGLGRLLNVEGIGLRSIDKLRFSGIRSFDDLLVAPMPVLEKTGLSKKQVSELRRVISRASR